MEFPETVVVGQEPFQRLYHLQTNLLLVEFNEEIPIEAIAPFLEEQGLFPIQDDIRRKENLPRRGREIHGRRQWVEVTDSKASQQLFEEDFEFINHVAPVYFEDGRGLPSAIAPLPALLLVETKALAQLPEEFQARETPQTERINALLQHIGYRAVPISDSDELSMFDLQKNYAGVEFEWRNYQSDSGIVLDPLVGWNLSRIKATGSSFSGWDITQGSPSVWIAILDSGCELTHPDLAFTPPHTHFDAEKYLANDPNFQKVEPVRAHGTAVSGVAAALFNTIGSAGVAGQCEILPTYHADSTLGETLSIIWATIQRANVINMSSDFNPTGYLHQAIQLAAGNEIVLVAAAGNDNLPTLVFPAAYPEVIAVGAMDQGDVRAQGFTWGSNWGVDLDVVAPGVTIATTDLLGSEGYNTMPSTDGDFDTLFDRTSAAAPHVAGLAALIVSCNNSLNSQEVRECIQSTCEKMNSSFYSYQLDTVHTDGLWNEQAGYGLIDVLAALQKSCPTNNSQGELINMPVENSDPNPTTSENPNLIQPFKNGEGSLIVRVLPTTPGKKAVSLTWVPDDPTEEPLREVIETGTDVPDLSSDAFDKCVTQYIQQNQTAESNGLTLQLQATGHCWTKIFE